MSADTARPVPAGVRYDYGSRAAAHAAQAPLARTSTRHLHLGATVRAVGLITAPGDHAGLWGVAEGDYRRGGRPNILATGDPSTYGGQHDLWDALGRRWQTWFTTALAEDSLPQIAVADRTAAARMAWSARRVLGHPGTSEPAAAAARYVVTAYSRMKAPGQQVLVCVTDLLREHYVTGADPADETHLGLWLEWPELGEAWDREQTGLADDFEAETTRFGKAVDRMHGSDGAMRETRAARVVPLLSPELTRRHHDVIAGLDMYRRHPGSTMPAATDRYAGDRRVMGRFVERATMPSRRSLAARVLTLQERETQTDHWRTALWAQDAAEAARGAMTGDVLAGEVRGSQIAVQGPVRARVGDVFTAADGDVTVQDLTVAEGQTIVDFDALLDPERDTVLSRKIAAIRPGQWVRPGWAHDPTLTAPASGPVPARVDLAAWAEELKAPATRK